MPVRAMRRVYNCVRRATEPRGSYQPGLLYHGIRGLGEWGLVFGAYRVQGPGPGRVRDDPWRQRADRDRVSASLPAISDCGIVCNSEATGIGGEAQTKEWSPDRILPRTELPFQLGPE